MSEILATAFGALIVAVILLNVAEGIGIAVATAFVSAARWILKRFFGIDRPRSGGDSFVGKQVLVQEDFSPAEQSGFLEGYVVLDGERWRARAADGSQGYSSGELLSVSGREGLVLLVSHVEVSDAHRQGRTRSCSGQ